MTELNWGMVHRRSYPVRRAYQTDDVDRCLKQGGSLLSCHLGIGGFKSTPTEGSLGQRTVLPATLPSNKSAICGKSCGFWDVLCKGAKIQAGCGGGCYGIPVDCTIVIGGAVALVVLIVILKLKG